MLVVRLKWAGLGARAFAGAGVSRLGRVSSTSTEYNEIKNHIFQ